MYVVVQEIKLKKQCDNGAYTDFEVYTSKWYMNGKETISYGYNCINRAERTIQKAYKFSIHQSYRECGKVKKKQYVVGTFNYYDAIKYSFPFWDYYSNKIEAIATELDIEEEEIYDLLESKAKPIVDKIQEEFKLTEEYIKNKKGRAIIKEYEIRRDEFNKKYGQGKYEEVYDVFNVLRNKEKLEEIKQKYEEEEKTRRYYENFKSNYNYNYESSYSNLKQSNYKEEDRPKYKKIYKTLAAKFHPDKYDDNGEMMKFINGLKEEWGL